MKFAEHDVSAMYARLVATRERVHKLIMARELAASHKLEKMRHVRPTARKTCSLGGRKGDS